MSIERRLEVVQPIGVGLLRQDRRPVVVGEGVLDSVGVAMPSCTILGRPGQRVDWLWITPYAPIEG